MHGRPYLWFVWPALLVGVILLASIWPRIGIGLLAPPGIPQRIIWDSLFVLLVAIPILSVVFPLGRPLYVFVASVVVLAVALGLAVAFNGGISAGLSLNSNHYRWLAVWELLSFLLAWVSIAAMTRYLTKGRELAARMIVVSALYLFAIMVLAVFFGPLEKLLFLTFSYGTSLFTFMVGNGNGLIFPHAIYNLTIIISLGMAASAWCVMGIFMWSAGHAKIATAQPNSKP